MNVKLIGYNTLRMPLELEGDTIVEKDEDLLLNEKVEGSIPTVAVKALGFNLNEGEEAFMITQRYFNEWQEQRYISFSLPTLMNNNLGYKEESGRAGRYIQTSLYDEFFILLTPLLDKMNYKGFISLKFNKDREVIDVLFGAGLALYSILEGVKGKLSDFFFYKENVLESWSTSLILTRYPYPFKEMDERLFLNIPSSMEKHLWFYDVKGHKKVLYTDNTKICIVSAWATSLNEVARRVSRTCNGLNIPLKQYRTDIVEIASKSWTEFITK